MTTLVAAMTDPSYAGMVIVIAGYPRDMDVMLNRNAGLKSRFKRFIDFPDWEAEDGVAFLRAKALKEEMTLEPGAEVMLLKTFEELKKLDGFGNGRDAVGMWDELKQCRAQRVFTVAEMVRTITAVDAAIAGESILAARRPPDGPILSQSSILHPSDGLCRPREQHAEVRPSLCELSEDQESETHLQAEQMVGNEEALEADEQVVEVEAARDEEPVGNGNIANEERDIGVSDEDWEELQRAKEDHAAHVDGLRRAREQAKLEEERRRVEAIQAKIRQICPCPAGYSWYKCGTGWRCGGGSHFVSDAQLNNQFTC
ncbi:unnamed protein product [Hyaloperonospora brassicae]|nr:unnamed protein product [Hyaloperonospora brassicae]